MTSTLSREIVEEHRLDQLQLRATVVATLLDMWDGFDPAAIDESWQPLEPGVVLLVEQGRQRSAQIAGTYYQEFRAAERVRGTIEVAAAPGVPRERLLTSLRVTAPVTAKRLALTGRPDVAATTFTHLAGSVSRHVLNGGISTILRTGQRDEQRVGWARVTGPNPCAFCAMLATRGGAYRREETARFRAHDHCACTVAPVYDLRAPLLGAGEEWEALYREATRDAPKGSLLTAFRAAYREKYGRG